MRVADEPTLGVAPLLVEESAPDADLAEFSAIRAPRRFYWWLTAAVLGAVAVGAVGVSLFARDRSPGSDLAAPIIAASRDVDRARDWAEIGTAPLPEAPPAAGQTQDKGVVREAVIDVSELPIESVPSNPAAVAPSVADTQRDAPAERALRVEEQRSKAAASVAPVARSVAPNAQTAPPASASPGGTTADSSARANKPGMLALSSIPESRVRIDGKDVGHTPRPTLSLKSGKHQVEFSHPKLGTRVVEVEIHPGKKRAVSVRF
jgi:hypothetical protein